MEYAVLRDGERKKERRKEEEIQEVIHVRHLHPIHLQRNKIVLFKGSNDT